MKRSEPGSGALKCSLSPPSLPNRPPRCVFTNLSFEDHLLLYLLVSVVHSTYMMDQIRRLRTVAERDTSHLKDLVFV